MRDALDEGGAGMGRSDLEYLRSLLGGERRTALEQPRRMGQRDIN